MHQIKINYGSGHHLERSLPSSWGEVPEASRWDLLHRVLSGKPTAHILTRMLSLPKSIVKRITTAQWYDLIKSLDWMYADLPINKPLVSSICPRKVTLYFPAQEFTNVTGREYAMMDDMIVNGTSEDRMLAVLCRPTSPDRPHYDKRIPLTSREQIDAWLPEVQAIPEEIRTYLHVVFSGYRINLYETYKEWLFPSSVASSSDDDDKKQDSGGLDFGWWGAFISIAKDGVFGTYEQVLNTPIHNICMHLVKEVEESRNMQEQHDHAVALAKMKS